MSKVLLIRGGQVWDGQRFFEADILTEDDRVVEIGPGLSANATFSFDAKGMIVSAGLVDGHAHLRGAAMPIYGIQAEAATFPFGVTAANEAGAVTGDKTVLEHLMVRSCAFILTEFWENRPDLAKTETLLSLFGDRVAGVKAIFDNSDGQVTSLGPLEEVCRFAHERGLRMMVHCTNSPVPMAGFLPLMQKGDILTHTYHGGRHSAAEDGFAALREARRRGVILDAAMAGYMHIDYPLYEDAIREGIGPDVISTDITRNGAYIRGGRYGLTMCMSISRTLGMTQEAVFRAVTSNPAKALGRENRWGALKVGGIADIAVIKEVQEPFRLTDRAGHTVKNDRSYRCALTVCRGDVVYKD